MVESYGRLAITDEDRVAPDVLVPSQYAARRPAAPERALLSSVLLDAVECFKKYRGATTRARRQLFEDAEHWIFGTTEDVFLSFEDTCEFLSLDPECLRRGLRRWRDGQPTRASQGEFEWMTSDD